MSATTASAGVEVSRRRLRFTPRALILALIITALLFYLVVPLRTYVAQRNRLSQLERQTQILEQQNQVLSQQVARLSVLGDGSNPNTLVLLKKEDLTDGPWCPDVNNANRWDADLLRIRRIGVTLRVEAAPDSMRGPAGMLFTRGGTAKGNQWIPDQEIRFSVSPRNLNLGR